MHQKKTRYRLLPCLFLFLLFASCERQQEAEQPRSISDSITVSSTKQDLSALLYIAEDRGLFRQNGVEVTLIDVSSGVASAQQLRNGEVDIALMSDFAFVNQFLKNDNLMILASIADADNTQLVARRDRGINSPADLAGKTIGLKIGSSPDFLLGTYLVENNVSPDDIKKVNLDADEFVDAIREGKVDALAAWMPHTINAFKELGENGVVWSLQGDRKKFWLMVARSDRLPGRETVRDVLQALVEARAYYEKSATAAEDFIRQRLGLTGEYMDNYFSRNVLRLSLSSELLSNMEFQTRWVIKQKGAGHDIPMPDYLEKIYFLGLEEVAPAAVTIIH